MLARGIYQGWTLPRWRIFPLSGILSRREGDEVAFKPYLV
jgi:hypothetical protein